MFKTLLIAVIAALATSTNGVSLKKTEAKAALSTFLASGLAWALWINMQANLLLMIHARCRRAHASALKPVVQSEVADPTPEATAASLIFTIARKML